jgi:hypothetical protein
MRWSDPTTGFHRQGDAVYCGPDGRSELRSSVAGATRTEREGVKQLPTDREGRPRTRRPSSRAPILARFGNRPARRPSPPPLRARRSDASFEGDGRDSQMKDVAGAGPCCIFGPVNKSNPDCTADPEAATASAMRAPSRARRATAAWLRAIMFTLVAWSALLCTGLGGTVGVFTYTLAGKLATHLHQLQRQPGTSMATRAAPRGLPHVAATHQFAEARCCAIADHAGGALPSSESALRVGSPQAHRLSSSKGEPPRKPDNRAHPSRAPPALA